MSNPRKPHTLLHPQEFGPIASLWWPAHPRRNQDEDFTSLCYSRTKPRKSKEVAKKMKTILRIKDTFPPGYLSFWQIYSFLPPSVRMIRKRRHSKEKAATGKADMYAWGNKY